MRFERWLAAALLGLVLVGGCMPSSEPSASAEPLPSAAASGLGGLPPGCEAMELRGPSGDRFDLAGSWIEDADTDPMVWELVVAGNCVWGVGMVEGVAFEDAVVPSYLQTLRGRVGTDFAIDGEMVLLGPDLNFLFRYPVYAPVRIVIVFDESGEIVLREDREHGVSGPRCVEPTTSCIRPLVLRRVP